MKKLLLALPVSVLVSACATIIDETSTTAVLQSGFYAGKEYQIRTRLLEGPNGPYERTDVVYRSVSRNCIKDSPGDCEKAAELLIDSYLSGIGI